MASKTSDVRPKITMACVDCKARNYITKKNRRNTPDRLELSKFCPTCGKQTDTARPAEQIEHTSTKATRDVPGGLSSFRTGGADHAVGCCGAVLRGPRPGVR